jgi:hypothetical protein
MKNYTSTVAPEKSIMQIEQLLIKHGAKSIGKDYAPNGKVQAISFVIKNPETDLPVGIRIPADPEAVFIVLKAAKTRWMSTQQEQSLREQAERTAWRLMLDWVAVQMSMIEMRQAELVQVFLPYIWNGTTTLFQQMKAAQTPAIGYKGGSEETADDQEPAEAE